MVYINLMLTIFTIPKAFRGQFKIIQTNAIKSWIELQPKCEVILFGNEEDTAETANELGVKHIPEINRNKYGTPLISAAFETVQQVAKHQIMCYANADIIMMRDFPSIVGQVRKRRFVIVGQRWDVDVNQSLDYSKDDWDEQLKLYTKEFGVLHSKDGIDYFVFPRGQYRNIPPFAVGRPGWDNWMIYHSRLKHIPVIDASSVILAVHQNHDYSHHPDGTEGVWNGPEAKYNLDIVKNHNLDLRDATFILGSSSLKSAITINNFRRYINTLTLLYPKSFFGIRLLKVLLRKLRGINEDTISRSKASS